jgi:hypothetical protein
LNFRRGTGQKASSNLLGCRLKLPPDGEEPPNIRPKIDAANCLSRGFAFQDFKDGRDPPMAHFYQPDLSTDLDSPFIRDGEDKLVRRSYWLDMDDRTLVMVMVNGIGDNLTNEEKRAHLMDLRREYLIDKICIQEILPPEK